MVGLEAVENSLQGPSREELVGRYANLFFAAPEFSTFLTGTFRGHTPSEAEMWDAAASFLRRLGQSTHRPVPALMVLESKDQGQRPNVHFLVAGVDHLTDRSLQNAWSGGNLDIRRPIEGGAFTYLARKAVFKEAPWDFWPPNFHKAVRRLRFLNRKRGRGPLYDCGGRESPALVGR